MILIFGLSCGWLSRCAIGTLPIRRTDPRSGGDATSKKDHEVSLHVSLFDDGASVP
jgi:hypothetical protein